MQKLDKSLIPNIDNLDRRADEPRLRPEPRRTRSPGSPAWTGSPGTRTITGGPVTSIEQLFTDPKLKGKVTILEEMADSVGLVLLDNGDDPANVTRRGVRSCDLDASRRPWTRAKSGIPPATTTGLPLVRGDFAACVAWSGDLAQLVLENPNLKWAVPEKGGIIWTDNMLIPLGGSVPTASTYMNFVYDPKISAQTPLGTGYITSVKGRRGMRAVKARSHAASNQLVFPR